MKWVSCYDCGLTGHTIEVINCELLLIFHYLYVRRWLSSYFNISEDIESKWLLAPIRNYRCLLEAIIQLDLLSIRDVLFGKHIVVWMMLRWFFTKYVVFVSLQEWIKPFYYKLKHDWIHTIQGITISWCLTKDDIFLWSGNCRWQPMNHLKRNLYWIFLVLFSTTYTFSADRTSKMAAHANTWYNPTLRYWFLIKHLCSGKHLSTCYSRVVLHRLIPLLLFGSALPPLFCRRITVYSFGSCFVDWLFLITSSVS